MMKRISCIIMCIMLVAQVAKVGADNKNTDARSSIGISDNTQINPEQQNNAFCFKLWRELDQKNENLFVSPYSINTALAMVYSGAKNETAREIAEVMGYSLPMDEQHLFFAKYQADLNSIADKKQAELKVANALFAHEDNADQLIPAYIKVLKDSFNSEMHTLDFENEAQSATFINRWVERRTNSRIKNMVSKEDIAYNKGGIILVNAIYFKGNWLHKFPLRNTHVMKFYQDSKCSPSSAKDFEMMNVTSSFSYAELPGYQILEMPYEEEDLAMIFVLPDEIKDIAKDLNSQTWQDWMAALKPQEVVAYIPRFKLELSISLVDHFKKLGMQDAFDPNKADFSGIMKVDYLYIQKIYHKAFLEIKEEGSEAAAATMVSMFAPSSISPKRPQPVIFMANKPFLCMIIHKPDNNILFMGKVVKPVEIKQ